MSKWCPAAQNLGYTENMLGNNAGNIAKYTLEHLVGTCIQMYIEKWNSFCRTNGCEKNIRQANGFGAKFVGRHIREQGKNLIKTLEIKWIIDFPFIYMFRTQHKCK